jgi:hypothetical protein
LVLQVGRLEQGFPIREAVLARQRFLGGAARDLGLDFLVVLDTKERMRATDSFDGFGLAGADIPVQGLGVFPADVSRDET